MTALASLSGCYVMQAATGQLDVLSRREPIQRVIQRPATPEPLRARLQYVANARQFAVTELGLPDNASYRTYSDVRRDFVVWNVFATPEFAVEPRRWCFPIAGCVVYRGYFNRHSAEGYSRRLRARGYDTSIGGVAAYSTLGHFADPVLNTMMNWSDAQLASTLFHELAHQVLYVPGDSEFNEAFATVVEEEGLTRWLERRGRSSELTQWQTQRARDAAVASLLLDTREQLRSLYRLRLAPEATRYRKNVLFGQLKYRYWQLKAQSPSFTGYDRFFDRALNNAHLVAVATYRRCVPLIQREFVAAGSNFENFYARMRTITAKAGASGICERLGSRQPSP